VTWLLTAVTYGKGIQSSEAGVEKAIPYTRFPISLGYAKLQSMAFSHFG
jgi:hypothetical protein